MGIKDRITEWRVRRLVSSLDTYKKMRKAINKLARIGGPAVPALIDAFRNGNWPVNWRAAELLIKIRDARAVSALIEVLKDDDKLVRRRAAAALGDIKAIQAVPALIEALKDDYQDVRYSAAEALGKIGDAMAVEPLIKALNDDDLGVRWGAAGALDELADVADIDLSKLRPSLKEFVERGKDPDERELAKRKAASIYAKMAKTVSERKKKEMPGEMLPARIKPPKKGIYRIRRALAR